MPKETPQASKAVVDIPSKDEHSPDGKEGKEKPQKGKGSASKPKSGKSKSKK